MVEREPDLVDMMLTRMGSGPALRQLVAGYVLLVVACAGGAMTVAALRDPAARPLGLALTPFVLHFAALPAAIVIGRHAYLARGDAARRRSYWIAPLVAGILSTSGTVVAVALIPVYGSDLGVSFGTLTAAFSALIAQLTGWGLLTQAYEAWQTRDAVPPLIPTQWSLAGLRDWAAPFRLWSSVTEGAALLAMIAVSFALGRAGDWLMLSGYAALIMIGELGLARKRGPLPRVTSAAVTYGAALVVAQLVVLVVLSLALG